MDPVAALKEIANLLERELAPTYRVRAFRKAAWALETLDREEIAARVAAGTLTELTNVGKTTSQVVAEAVSGDVPAYLVKLREQAPERLAEGGEAVRSRLRGDLHSHSDWSDGGSPIREMAEAAVARGHDYLALTDHSPRLTVANGLSAERLRRQLQVVAGLNEELAPFRILAGIEVDILEDGSLDQDEGLLAELDVVVASVHSKLRMDSDDMTRRMVNAVANPHVDVLGHCTGRLITGGRGKRPESQFEADVVFEACRRFGVAVEINSRPERRDPPSRLIKLAYDSGCMFSIDTDAHAPGQLDFLDYGCARAVELGIDPQRVVNTREAAHLFS
jgi:putative hydrolase